MHTSSSIIYVLIIYIYIILQTIGNYYVPTYKFFTAEFMK